MSNYRKTMTEALREMYPLNEGTIDKVKEIASKKQAMKIDGVMVDSFTASAISQIYDKVNDANKKKMDKLPITKLANLAFKMMQKNEFVPEEVDLDEAKYTRKLMKNKSIVDYVKKQQEKNRKDVAKFGNKKVGAYGNEPRFDSGAGWNDMAADEIKLSSMSLNKRKSFDSEAEYEAIARKLGLDKFEPKLEETELDEGKMQDMWQKKNAQSLSVGPFELLRGKSGVHTIKRSGKVLGDFSYDSDADNFVANMKGMKGQWTGNDIDSLFTHLQKVHKEEVETELDEEFKKGDKVTVKVAKSSDREIQQLSKKFGDTVSGVVMGQSGKILMVKTDKGQINPPVKDVMKEEVELDEGKMSQLHQYIKDKKSPEEIAKLMKLDVKTIKALMNSHHPEEVEESKTTVPMSTKAGQSVKKGQVPKGMYGNAARDARRAMGRDPEMRQRPFSKDDSATDDDVKGASKNIMMQMRKAQSLNGRFDVEFADGKKVKIPAKMAIAVQQKYNKMRRPAEKEKFQAKIAKSYRDMLSALKEAVSPAQQAAIAISKKERGEKPKKESVLDRIDKKIKEKNDG